MTKKNVVLENFLGLKNITPNPLNSAKSPFSLCVKFLSSSTPPSDRFWWGVLVVLLVVLVTGVKQSQLLVLRLSLEFDNIII